MLTSELVTKEDLEKAKLEIIQALKENLMDQAPSKTWLKGKEVQSILGVSASGLQNLRINGIIPFSKVSGIIYYRMKDIQNLLTKNLQNNEQRDR